MSGTASEMRVTRSARRPVFTVGPMVVLLVVLAYLPFAVSQGITSTMVNFFILLVMATMWNLLAGYGGLVSVGQQAYIGLGAYLVLILADHGVNPFLALPVAVVICAVVSLPVSLLVFRLSGGYFAIGTWVVSEVFVLVIVRFSSLGGGTGANLPGLSGVSPTLLNALTYWVSLGVAAIGLAGGYALLRSRVGLSLTAVRDNERAARSLGVAVSGAKRVVYLVSAAGCAAAGGLLIISQLNVEPASVFNVQWSAYMIFVVLIGGIGSLEGPILGAVVFFVLQQALASYGGWYLIVLGSIAALMALFARRGIWGWLDQRVGPLFPVGYRLRLPEVTRPVLAREEAPGDSPVPSP